MNPTHSAACCCITHEIKNLLDKHFTPSLTQNGTLSNVSERVIVLKKGANFNLS